mmetsp:Transcript_35170/g.105141  ORF Transcript_35170/g.105141 Transcript_35170/m.105141 type:complete len:135 (-) Transcript_35170:363-767(-)
MGACRGVVWHVEPGMGAATVRTVLTSRSGARECTTVIMEAPLAGEAAEVKGTGDQDGTLCTPHDDGTSVARPGLAAERPGCLACESTVATGTGIALGVRDSAHTRVWSRQLGRSSDISADSSETAPLGTCGVSS